MAAETDIIRYVITGEEGEVIPPNATHVSVHPSVRIILAQVFYEHPNIVELICHDGVIKIERYAFAFCPHLKRVIMNGVEEIVDCAFQFCEALEYVECEKLEIIGQRVFSSCNSLNSINLPSAKIARALAFSGCPALVDANFGRKLESIGGGVFYDCRFLERITLPLKTSLFEHDNTFRSCENLRHVDLVDEEVLQQTIDALLCEGWKDDMNVELVLIDQILPNATAGNLYDAGDKAIVIRQWITNVLRKIIYYKVEHRRLLKEAESRLQLALPHDIVMNNIVPFLTLPQHTFDGEEEIDESDDSNQSIDERYSFDVYSNEDDHGGAVDAVGERSQDGANDEERRKRQRTETNGTT